MNDVKMVKLTDIEVNKEQPRTYFDDNSIEGLAVSIRENGLVQPLTVRIKDNHYELVAGERRLRACTLLGYEEVPVYLIESNDQESMYMALVENIQRENLSAIEEAKAYLKIMQLHHMTQAELSEKIGKSQPTIANKIRLLNLDVNVQNAIEAKLINERHARAMLGLDSEKQNDILSKIVKDKWSVAQTETVVKATLNKKEKKMEKGYSRNVQIGVNTIKRAVDMVMKSGLDVQLNEVVNEDDVIITVKIKNRRVK